MGLAHLLNRRYQRSASGGLVRQGIPTDSLLTGQEMHPVISACVIPQLDEAGFEEKVLASPLPVFVHFAEVDCRECDMPPRFFGDVPGQLTGRTHCYCIHAPTSPLLTARYRIAQLPTILLFRNARVSRRLVGHPLPGQLETILRAEIPAHSATQS